MLKLLLNASYSCNCLQLPTLDSKNNAHKVEEPQSLCESGQFIFIVHPNTSINLFIKHTHNDFFVKKKKKKKLNA